MRPLTSTLVFLALSACGSKWEAADLDGDGYTVAQGDCFENAESTGGIASADIHPGATETWYDGFDQDCSGGSDFDKDGDGHASVDAPDPTGELPSDDCWDDPDVVPDGFEATDPSEQLDAALVFPGAGETWYDGIDQDCGGDDDFDQDGDGYASATFGDGDDCFDADEDDFANAGGLEPGDVNPDAVDTWYDGTDADCAGNDDFDQDGDGWAREVECDDTDPLRFPNDDPEVWYDGLDANCDGNDGDQDGDGFYAADYAFEVPPDYQAGDCWDDPADGALWTPLNGFDPLAPAAVSPDAEETWYDGLDQDCAGDGDFDKDGDGFETSAYADAGGLPGDDCDDSSVSVFPGAPEEWYNDIDEDCAGDDDFDQDHDGFTNDVDCSDTDDAINPGANETCGNSVDEDCSGSDNDDGAVLCTPFFSDSDGDGWGGADEVCTCYASGLYTATSDGDCDDDDLAVNPDGTESCDTPADDDCDGSTNAVGAAGCDAWYVDGDDDGYGGTSSQCQCEASGAYTADNDDDCNDAAASVSPGASETCNAVDDDCDGSTDEGLPLYYTDADGDEFGTGTGTCTPGGAENADDCDDSLATVYPGAPELCDGEANDCDTLGTWTASSEDQLVSYVTTGGVWEDISADFGATATNYALEPSGTYYFCAGTYYTKFVGSSDTVDIVGVYGADETIIDNNIAGATVTVSGGSVTLTGLTITGGLGSGSAGSTYGGGVIAAATSMPTTPTTILEDCIVRDNDAAYGGGVAAYTSSWVQLVRTEVSSNTATANGGGVWASTTGKVTAEDSVITDNTAAAGGGVYGAGAATLTFTGTDVHTNTSTGDGGGIYADDGVLTLTSSNVYDNTAGDDAGGIFIDTGTATCSSGGVYGNDASDHGGGVYLSNYSVTTSSFTSTACDFGTGATDNSPSDVTIKTAVSETSGSYTNYTSYSSTATFTCLTTTDLCTP